MITLYIFLMGAVVAGGSVPEACFKSGLQVARNMESVRGRKVFVKKMAALTPRRTVESCNVLLGLVSVQTFSMDIIHALGNV